MARLWEKGTELDALVHRFTVGDDPFWDRHLVRWDCFGSAAHAMTLQRAGILRADEAQSLVNGLREIVTRADRGDFEITSEDEDCHTAIEGFLTQRCGEAGRRIHAGRSRNDQVATAMRLYLRHHALEWLTAAARLADAALDRIERDGDVSMPGYTHLQPAMPSSVGMWLHAVVEALLEQQRAALDLLARLDCCPLGTGAGYGPGLPLDRAYTAALLGFSRVQRSPLDVQAGRGRMEAYFVRVGADLAAVLEKLAWDVVLFSTAEFGFLRLPECMTTGSSLMPQKRNPDVCELLRARAARLRGRLVELEWISGKLPSGYHRDLQLTKEPAIRTAIDVSEMLAVATAVVAGFELDRAALARAMRDELYAADAALARVRQGVPFRDAYRQIADEIRSGAFRRPESSDETGPASISRELIEQLRRELEETAAAVKRWKERIGAAGAMRLEIP